jgi:hypothetical protein
VREVAARVGVVSRTVICIRKELEGKMEGLTPAND